MTDDIVARLRDGWFDCAGDAADEIERLRGEVERLTRERDDANEALTISYMSGAHDARKERDAAIARTEKWEDDYYKLAAENEADEVALKARAEAAERERDRARKQAADMWKDCAERVSTADAKVATARAEALEEAAALFEGEFVEAVCASIYAKRIRALKETKG